VSPLQARRERVGTRNVGWRFAGRDDYFLVLPQGELSWVPAPRVVDG
jgi:hypothetical protein